MFYDKRNRKFDKVFQHKYKLLLFFMAVGGGIGYYNFRHSINEKLQDASSQLKNDLKADLTRHALIQALVPQLFSIIGHSVTGIYSSIVQSSQADFDAIQKYATTLHNEAAQALKICNYRSAEVKYLQASKLFLKIYTEENKKLEAILDQLCYQRALALVHMTEFDINEKIKPESNAVANLKFLIEENPQNMDALNLLGLIYYLDAKVKGGVKKKESHKKANEYFIKSLKLSYNQNVTYIFSVYLDNKLKSNKMDKNSAEVILSRMLKRVHPSVLKKNDIFTSHLLDIFSEATQTFCDTSNNIQQFFHYQKINLALSERYIELYKGDLRYLAGAKRHYKKAAKIISELTHPIKPKNKNDKMNYVNNNSLIIENNNSIDENKTAKSSSKKISKAKINQDKLELLDFNSKAGKRLVDTNQLNLRQETYQRESRISQCSINVYKNVGVFTNSCSSKNSSSEMTKSPLDYFG